MSKKQASEKADADDSTSGGDISPKAHYVFAHLNPWEEKLLKIFPLQYLTGRQYIELCLISAAGATWLSFFHVLWWGVEKAFIHLVFYSTSLYVIMLAHCTQYFIKDAISTKNFIQNWVPILGSGLFLLFLTVFGVGQEYRILADETNLLGSALSFYIDQTYQNITEGTFYYDSFHPTEKVLDKRPALFPYLISMLHFLTGYRAENGFYVNAMMAFFSGGLLFYIGRKYVDTVYGIMVVLCYASLPIVMIGMGSSGFEVMTALFNTAVVWRCVEFYKNPTSRQLELLALCLLGASQGRYESVILILPVGLTILVRLQKITWDPSAIRLLIIPYLFIPLNWQKHITSSLNGGDPEGTVTFSLKYLEKHLLKFMNFWFDFRQREFPSSLPLTIASILGIYLLLHHAIKFRHNNGVASLKWALLTGGLATFAIIGAQLLYYMGDVSEPAMQRFAIAYAPAIAFCAAYFFWKCYQVTRRSLFIPGIMVVILFLSMSIASRNPLGKSLILFREYKTMLNFVKTFPISGTLIVSGRPGMFTVHGYGAISPETLLARPMEWKSNMERKLFTNVIFEEFVYYDPTKNDKEPLPGYFSKETLYEYQNEASYYVRFSRLHIKDVPIPKNME